MTLVKKDILYIQKMRDYQRKYRREYREKRLNDMIENNIAKEKKRKRGINSNSKSTWKSRFEIKDEMERGFFNGTPEKTCKSFGCTKILSYREIIFGDTCISCS